MWRTVSLAAMLLLVTANAHASSDVLGGTLGRWLDIDAGPRLLETLSTHPRFRGEAIRIVAMDGGKVSATSNRLVDAVRGTLTRELLDKPGVHIAWDNASEDCQPRREPNYLLGIDIKDAGSRKHQLTLSMVDVNEGVWVAGINLSWRGRLNTTQRRALASPMINQSPGSIGNPLAAHASDQIARQLSSDALCSFKTRFPGVVFVDHDAPDTDGHRAAVLSEVQQHLGRSTLALTSQRDSAEWLLRIDRDRAGTATERWTLALHDTAAGATVQHLGSVYVVPGYSAQSVSSVAHASGATTHLSAFRINEADRKGICRHSEPGAECKEVSIDLFEPAYVMVFYTRDGEIDAFGCHDRVEKKGTGTHSYRVQFPLDADTLGRPSAGVYALATTDRKVAQSFNRHFNSAPGACSSMKRGDMDQWFTRLLSSTLR